MIKKTIAYFWSLRRQFLKYFAVGISAVILDMGSLIFFKEILGMAPVVAVAVNQILILIFVFTLNKYWSFQDHSLATHRQIVRFLILATFNYFFAVAAMYIFNHRLKFDYRLVRLVSIAAMVSWNFFIYKYWVYAKQPQPTNNGVE